MAAEVALLSRNIKIHGEANGEPCIAYDVNTCKDDPLKYDLLGGHIMTLSGTFDPNLYHGISILRLVKK